VSGLLIRWRDPALWPGVLAHVPPGCQVVRERDRAEQAGVAAFASLDKRRRRQYTDMWLAALDLGLQPSGLLLVNLLSLASVIGHRSPRMPRAMNQFCIEQKVWCRVPGKLYPHPRDGDLPGQRSFCYLVIEAAPADRA
jgi:hypothetical protein